jgi:hypothetical protein
MGQLSSVVLQLQKERQRMVKGLQQIDVALAALNAVGGSRGRTRGLSASARARISAAQRARWAKLKGKGQSGTKAARKRTLSAAARKKIAAAQRARWAKVKGSKKAA